MGTRALQCLIFFIFGLLFCSGSDLRVTEKPLVESMERKKLNHEEKLSYLPSSQRKLISGDSKFSSTQMDVITPLITTTPTTVIPSPVIPSPVIDPYTTPAAPTTTTPTIPSPAISSPATSSGSGTWCIASQTASQTAFQVALDYACGFGGADCSAIQSGGNCYNPNTVRDHASYAFNNYYQKNPVPTSCNFGGIAMITNSDPSSGSCQFPSSSTSNGGSESPGSTSNTVAFISQSFSLLFSSTCLILSIYTVNLF